MRENRAVDPFDLPPNPRLSDLLRALGRQVKLSIRTHVPARVVAYDPATQTANVQVELQQVVRYTDPQRLPAGAVPSGTPPNGEATLPPTQIMKVPVVWPRTLAGYVTFPLVSGDTGELHISDRSLEQWRLAGAPTDPGLAFTHALKDAVFHPGLHPDTQPITPATDLTATVVEGTLIKLGRQATADSVAKAELFLAELVTAITNAATAPNDGGATFKTNLLTNLGAITPAQIGSLKVKVE